MLRSVKMAYFKQHVDRTINFTPGVNGIRAPNGSGKSNALMAARYALYGAKALSEKLENVVTYDQPVSKLKVELDFDFAGVDYRIVRSKSGAELTFASERVTGQNEVTKFVENLFGASQDIGAKLMFAKQKAVGGALSDGPTATSELIESLADLDLVNELVGLVQEKLPSGSTDVQESLVSTLREQATEPEPIDLAPLQDANTAAVNAMETANKSYKTVKAQLDNLDLDAARAILTDEKLLHQAITNHETGIASLQATLERKLVKDVADSEIEAVQAKIAAQKDLVAAEKLHQELKAANVEELWDKPLAELEAEISQTELTSASLQAKASASSAELLQLDATWKACESQYRVDTATIEGKLIRETTCSLCQKDLKDVPEVALINNPLSAKLAEMTEDHAAASRTAQDARQRNQLDALPLAKALADAKAYLKDLQDVLQVHQRLCLLYARAEQWITLDERVVPFQWTWAGPTAAPQDYAGKLLELQADRRKFLADQAARAAATESLASTKSQLDAAKEKLAALQLADARETLELELSLKPQVQTALEAAQRAERALAAAKQEFELRRQQKSQQDEQIALARASLATAEAALAEMRANNALIKKLRAARGPIADQLWAMVLAATSVYYSEMRGDRFTFTRAGGEFLVNGKPTSGLSGAEEDILGLAIRMALTRMFLPTVDFLVLDEVAAACDDERENAILGLLSTVGFAQVILVTHSPQVEAVADTIINL